MDLIEFPFAKRRPVRAVFDASPISSDGGAILLRRVDDQLRLVEQVSHAIDDRRDARWVRHSPKDLFRQRVFQIALGYEDCNDANRLRADAALKVACGRAPDELDLASQPTLSRFENQAGPKQCYRMGRALVQNYFVRHRRAPTALVLDLDTSADITHGQQEFAAFHGFYDEYVYLPLFIFDQDGDLVAAMLQPGRAHGVGPAAALLDRVLREVRRRWPDVKVTVRGDSGFAAPSIYAVCERSRAHFIFGMQPNVRLKRLAVRLQEKACRRYLRRGTKVRLFSSMRYRARRGWARSYRVLIKAEHQAAGANVRFVVTNLGGDAKDLYDGCYVQRAEACENSIKDLKNALKADRLSCHRFWANQFRLFLHCAAYVLLFALRKLAKGTELAHVQMDTLRLRVLKIGARIVATARRVWIHLSSAHPSQAVWLLLARRLS
jgi:hypothetical protein